MKEKDLYTEAHLVVASIRILEHRNNAPPSVEAVSEMLFFSLEHANLICKKLNEIGIIQLVEGPFGTRLFVQDHLSLESIPKVKAEDALKEALSTFQASKKDYDREIESFKAKQVKKQKDLFAQWEQKLKDGLKKDS
ncbi:MAG: hypothetical protein V1714_00775 [Pseudomonadota bacterium]